MQTVQERVTKKNLSYAKKGILWGLLGGFLCGCPFIFNNFGMAQAPLSGGAVLGILVIPVVFAFLQDVGSFIVTFLALVANGKHKECVRAVRTKPGRMLVISSLFGGPVACTCAAIGIYFAGPVYPIAISAAFPALGAVLSMVFLKERINLSSWIGILGCVLGAAIISWAPPTGEVYPHFYLGVAFAVIAAIGWALEGIVSCAGMDFIDPDVAYTLSKFYAMCIHLFFMLPLVAGFSFKIYGLVIASVFSPVILFAMISGATFGIGYMYYYKCNNACGAARGMAFNITYVFWSAVIGVLFADAAVTGTFLIGLAVLMVGALLVAGKPSELLNLRNVE